MNKNDFDSCKVTIVDSETKRIIYGQIAVSLKGNNVHFIKNGVFNFKCSELGDLLIRPIDLGYDDTLVESVNIMNDSIFLLKSAYSFEEIDVVANKSIREKHFKLGRKNSRCSAYYGFQNMDLVEKSNQPVFNAKLVSMLTNNVKKRLELTKGFIYLKDVPIDSVPNLYLSFYKIHDGIPGKVIHEKLLFKSQNNAEGWFEIELNESIKIPSEGFYIVLEKMDLNGYSPNVGLINSKKEDVSNTYSYVNSIGDGSEFENKVIKIFFNAKR